MNKLAIGSLASIPDLGLIVKITGHLNDPDIYTYQVVYHSEKNGHAGTTHRKHLWQ